MDLKQIELLKSDIDERYILNFNGPKDHIISLGRKCNLGCSYCITNSKQKTEKLDFKNYKNIIDFIFTIPRNDYYIEFTGGEPFSNFDILLKIVDYAKKKSYLKNKKIHFSIVSNLTNTNDKHLKFILKNRITICSSLDGPRKIHNITRKNTYDIVIANLKKLIYYSEKGFIEMPNLITTVTKPLLKMHKEIVDEYINLKIMRVQIGFLDPIGRAKNLWDKIGYSSYEFFNFYKKTLNYILKLNLKKNIPVYEKATLILLTTILKKKIHRNRALDIINRLCYDPVGNIYPSDEGRIFGENNDFSFKIGNVKNNSFEKLLKNSKTLFFLLSNYQEIINPKCIRCEYSNYCKIPLYYTYTVRKSFQENIITNERCVLFKMIFNYLVELCENKKYRDIFKLWIERYI
jgi:uncharacterized protein